MGRPGRWANRRSFTRSFTPSRGRSCRVLRSAASGEEAHAMTDVLCFGDLLIDFVPTTSGLPLAEVETFRRAPGGAAANVAVGLARLGAKSAFMGKVGDDVFGHLLADDAGGGGCRYRPAALRRSGTNGARFRQPEERRRAGLSLLPASVGRHAVHQERGRPERHRRCADLSFRFDQPCRARPEGHGVVRRRRRQSREQAGELRCQSAIAALGGRGRGARRHSRWDRAGVDREAE